ncbi:MAG: glycosyl transferase [Candidatus Magasanikbacteria bacterium CG10_big_fil_rev_8_21_14_0_10_36_32]|uniref:Glycosyl transferase n=1 Tax=Candidatus Magasanikbacteria bacterium CG10_big_fil_rev_8_21_14_0_10_36_32 TaxID=1974646 RepID=A0A2M6W5P9_9BACT|nr:MAG: glycosyl transferase [Candidatus Magasanikbacteria bacterium CG10_big_fil_rev_8_21_14_0_10_36_32]
MNKLQIKEYFNKISNERDKWRRRNSYYHKDIQFLLSFLIPRQSKVLDVGCSTGDVLASIHTNVGKGIDFSPAMVAVAKSKYPSLNFEVMDVENLELNEKYDYIILSDVIGFLNDVQGTFQGLHKVSHNKTKVIITCCSQFWEPALKLFGKLHLKMRQPIQNWLSRGDIENILYLAGFEVIKKGERLLCPKYIPLISTFLNNVVAKLPLIRRLCLVNYFIARPKTGNQITSIPAATVSVIIPARNEKGNIEDAIKRVPKMGEHTEIVFVEGHSTDETLQEMERVKIAYPNVDIKILVQDGKGKGDAVRKGFDAACGDILMILDADLTVRPEELPKFYQAITNGAGEFINGSRLVYQLENDSMRTLNIAGNKFFSLMFSWLLDQRIKDTLCGTKVLRKENYEKIKKGREFFGDFDPFGDFDLLFGAAKLNLKIIDLPIRYQARSYGITNISRFKHGWLLLKMVLFAMRKIKFV